MNKGVNLNISLRKKIILSFSFVLIFVSIGGALSIRNNMIIGEGINISSERFNQLSAFLTFKYKLTHLNLQYMDAIIDSADGQVDEDILQAHNAFGAYIKESKENFHNLVDTEEERKKLDSVLSDVEQIHQAGTGLINAIKEKLGEQGMAEFDDVLDSKVDIASEKIQFIVDSITSEYNEASSHLSDTGEWATNLQYGVSLFLIFTIGISGFVFSSYLNSLLTHISKSLDEESTAIEDQALKVEDLSNNLNRITLQQSSAIQETSASIHEISAMVENNSRATVISKKDSDISIKTVIEGQKVFKEMIHSIHEMEDSNKQVSQQVEMNNDEIKNIVSMMSEIENKTQIINDIVFQTKLLSFNASVEAARAGEHGKGFSVVAEEIGNLAQVSGNASTEISELLESSTKRVSEIANHSQVKMNEMTQKTNLTINKSLEIAKKCEDSFRTIEQSVQTVGSKVVEISNASNEQSAGVKEVSIAISSINDSSHEISKLSSGSLEGSKKLRNGAEHLNGLVEKLQVILTGKNNNKVEITKDENIHHIDIEPKQAA